MNVQAQNSERFNERQYLLAELLFASGQDEEALTEYLNYLKLCDPNEERLYSCYKNLGNIYVRFGEFGLAEEFYNKAYALKPESVEIRVNFGTLEIQKDRLDVALNHFREALYRDLRSGKAWVGLALIHRSLGDHDLGYANLRSAIESVGAREMALQLHLEWSCQDHRVDQLVPLVDQVSGTADRTSFEERFCNSAGSWLAEQRSQLASGIKEFTESIRAQGRWSGAILENEGASV